MSEQTPEDAPTVKDEVTERPGSVTGARRPTGAAAAARRARRIGGGTAPRPDTRAEPGPATDDVDADPADASQAAPRISTSKTTAVSGAATGTTTAGTTTNPAVTTKAGSTSRANDFVDGEKVVTQVPRWILWAPAALLTAAALVMAVFIAVTSHGVWWSAPSNTAVRDKVLAAAKACTAATNSYKYTAIPAAEAGGVACTTGEYQSQYRTAMRTLIAKNAPKLKFTQTAQINDAAVESVTGNGRQWSVLIFGQLMVTSVQTSKAGRVDPFAAVVRMQSVDGKWLISKIDRVSAPG